MGNEGYCEFVVTITGELSFYVFVKGILTDVKLRVFSKLSNFEFFAYFRSSPLRTTIHQRNWAEIISVGNKNNSNRNSLTQEFIQHSSQWEQ